MEVKVKELYEEILGKENVLENEPMKKHISFKVGGNARYYLIPHSIEELTRVIALIRSKQEPYYILGNGSNLIVPDEGYEGTVIQVWKNLSEITVCGHTITAQAGAMLSTIAAKALEHSLAGFEFASGIPGTLGGAVTMNAGAYGGEMKDVLVQATVLDQDGKIQTLSKEQLQLGYRSSIISKEGLIVLEAQMEFQEGIQEDIREKMRDFNSRRREKQPLEYPSAGSTFKRPEGYFAGKLIQDAGLKGYRVGGAQVSEKHSGFVINAGNATAQDIFTLIQNVQEKVYEQFGVRLEMEVKILK